MVHGPWSPSTTATTSGCAASMLQREVTFSSDANQIAMIFPKQSVSFRGDYHIKVEGTKLQSSELDNLGSIAYI